MTDNIVSVEETTLTEDELEATLREIRDALAEAKAILTEDVPVVEPAQPVLTFDAAGAYQDVADAKAEIRRILATAR